MRLRAKSYLWGLLFMAPWLVGLTVFQLGPLVASFILSFTRYDIITPVNPAGEALLRGHRPGALKGLTFDELYVSAVGLRFDGPAKDKLVAEPLWGPRAIPACDGNGWMPTALAHPWGR